MKVAVFFLAFLIAPVVKGQYSDDDRASMGALGLSSAQIGVLEKWGITKSDPCFQAALSDFVALGVVTSKVALPAEKMSPRKTRIEVRIDSAVSVKGEIKIPPGSKVIIYQASGQIWKKGLDGKLAATDKGVFIDSEPNFAVGETVLLFPTNGRPTYLSDYDWSGVTMGKEYWVPSYAKYSVAPEGTVQYTYGVFVPVKKIFADIRKISQPFRGGVK